MRRSRRGGRAREATRRSRRRRSRRCCPSGLDERGEDTAGGAEGHARVGGERGARQAAFAREEVEGSAVARVGARQELRMIAEIVGEAIAAGKMATTDRAEAG